MKAHLLATLLLLVGCGTPPPPPPTAGPSVTALYDDTPGRADFFALPWPSDARTVVGADGKRRLDLGGFTNPGGIIATYLKTIGDEPLGGFGTNAAAYFRFDGAIDPATLPGDPAASVAAGASAFIADVTPSSPTYGKRTPVRVRFSADFGNFIGPNWLALLPEPGFPLRESTTYAAVLTDGLRGAAGEPVIADKRYHDALPQGAAAAIGIDAAHVVSATVFTTQDATSIMKALRDAVYAQAPAPTVADFAFIESVPHVYDHFEGTYEAPNFQEGDPPYFNTGGRIHLGADGKPQVVRTEKLRFAVTIPQADMPAAGWPVVIYAHGTGGSYTTFIDDGEGADAANISDAAGNLITHMAMISIDQVLHGPRDPTMSDPDLTFFNFNNIVAARDNAKQGGLDDFQLLRLVKGFSVDAAPKTGKPIKFDPSKIYFKGHSQGGLTGPLFLAFEPEVKGAVLSGAGANLVLALLGKTEPKNIPMLVAALLNEPVDEFHPFLGLLQTFLESSDPGNYARRFFREPPPGQAPKSIFHSLGIVDHYTPIPTIKAFTLAMGTQPVGLMAEPIPDLPLTGLTWGTVPLASNVAGGAATGVLCEYRVPTNASGDEIYDGHFVVSDDPDAIRQSNAFLGTQATTGVAHLIP